MSRHKKTYYLYVEIDPEHLISEVHEERYKDDTGTISDYGGNNTGFYPFYAYNQGEKPDEIQTSEAFKVASDAASITSVNITDSEGNLIQDLAAYLKARESRQFVTLTANFTYNGPDAAYAFFGGHILTQEGHELYPSPSLNNVVLIDTLPYQYVEDVFAFQDFALFNGYNSVMFTLSPEDVIASADAAMFGVIAITYEEIAAVEAYLGEDPTFTLDEIPDDIVASATEQTYTLKANEEVFWKISSVKLNDTVSTSDEDDEEYDDRIYLSINLETASKDEAAPSDYGGEVTITVTSIKGYTPKGDYEITIQKSANDGNEWTDAGTLKFSTTDSEKSNGNKAHSSSNGGGGCNAGFTFFALSLVLSALILRRKAL